MSATPLTIVNTLGELTDLNDTILGTAKSTEVSQRSLDAALEAGLAAVNVTLGYVSGTEDPVRQTRRELDEWDATICSNSDKLELITDVESLSSAGSRGRIGVIYGFQNATQVGRPDAELIDEWTTRGVRIVQLTYNDINQFGAGSSASEDVGLTPAGRELVAALNERNSMVDLSHSNRQTCLDAIKASSAPVSINHTGARALSDLPRNKSDEELRAVAEGGGFVGVYFMPFLRTAGTVSVSDVVDHITHMINVCGEDAVGVGTDGGVVGIDDRDALDRHFAEEHARRVALGIAAKGEGPGSPPFVADLTGPGQFRKLADALSTAGLSARLIEKVLGQNFVNFARRVWV